MDAIALTVKAMPENESLVRSFIAAYATRCNPSLEVINDIKTAVSEAVTNAIIHGYENQIENDICINAEISDNILKVSITDTGIGIIDIIQAMTDFYTTKPSEERSGIGFRIMSSFMDSLDVRSVHGSYTTVTMTKKLV
ncbi:MAG: anti-sigma F factor [Christensenellaceae bacterium]|jgi:stage II sporulation protein AB (anti-sigma F factor)|nr:anti-sigma F factor [Christensenellaceae bacterium]